MAEQLPEDLLLDVLRRLPARSLAVSRSVCNSWCAVVDGHRLLTCTDLLPLSLDGVFLEPRDPGPPYREPLLFSRRSTQRKILYMRRMPPGEFSNGIEDCCNGLLLLRSRHVFNPATFESAPLPPRPRYSCEEDADPFNGMDSRYLVFDPAMSMHYEVVSVPGLPWDRRLFVREGKAAGLAADCQSKEKYVCHYAAFWHGALYIPCEDDFVLRINLSSDKYQVVKLPEGKRLRCHAPRLGKSEKGVYCVFRYARDAFQVWFLDESSGQQMEWVLKNDINFDLVHESPCTIVGGSWILEGKGNNEGAVEDNSEWDPSNENVVSVEAWVGMPGPSATYDFLGFHPYKEIALFQANGSVMAYHLTTSKVRDLGFVPMEGNGIEISFPYMPCWMGPLPGCN